VSKYIGEVEKNLARAFADAAASVAALLFDEAAALFGRRSDVDEAQDRYLNSEVDHPPQGVETSGGIAILATGLAVMAVLGLCLVHRRRRGLRASRAHPVTPW
jgi:SpoVK/Ycf46/Vps4 family AAA+-type ATPase